MRESIRRGLKYTFATNILIGPVAQRLEQGTHNPLVVGSNPTGPTILKSLSSMGKGFFIPSFLGEGYLDGLFSHLFRKAISLMKLLKRY